MTATQHTGETPSLTHREAFAFLGASDICMKLSRITGELYGRPAPAFMRYGRAIRYLRSDLEAWLAAIPRHQSIAHEMASRRQHVSGAK